MASAEDEDKLCQLCKKTAFKYRCPKCQFKSCSLNCSKAHVADDLCKPLERPVQMEKSPDLNKVPVVEFEAEHTVPPARLAQLRHSEKLKNALSNPHLRRILSLLDTSTSPWKDVGNAMLEPVFTEFADACLEVLEPQEEMETDS